MPKASKVLSHVSSSRLASTHIPASIWITDELLANTFSNFCRNHRRHGSNVPGPLEAQRRAAKRRNTCIAYSSPYNPEPQPFELFGAKPKDGWWNGQKSNTNEVSTAPSWLWSMLSHSKPTTGEPPQESESPSTLDSPTSEIRCENTEEELFGKLNDTRKHIDLILLLQTLSINLSRQPQLTQRLLDHMFAKNWELEELANFFLDPRMNPSGSANFVYVLENAQQYRSAVVRLIEKSIFSRAAALGLLGVEELRSILTLAPNLDIEVDGSEYSFAWMSFCVDILSALTDSKVIQLEDLGMDFILGWKEVIKSAAFQPGKPLLLWTIYRALGHVDRKALKKVVRNCIQTIDNARLRHMRSLVDFVAMRPRGQLRDILTPVTQDLITEAAVNYTPSFEDRAQHVEAAEHRSALLSIVLESQDRDQDVFTKLRGSDEVFHHEYGRYAIHIASRDDEVALLPFNRQPSDLEKWYAFLRSFTIISSQAWSLRPGFLTAYHSQTELGLQEWQLFIIQIWASMALFGHCRWKLPVRTKRKASSLMTRLLLSCDDVDDEDKLVTLLKKIQSLPLPAKDQLLNHAAGMCPDLLRHGETHAMLWEKINDLLSGQVSNLSKTRYYHAAQFSTPALLREVTESMNEDMCKFETTCRHLIRETIKGPVLVYRLLCHNRALKFALRRATILTASSIQQGKEAAVQEKALGDYSYDQIVDMVNNFASECARNPHLSPRNRLTKVSWYYQFLHRCRAPIKPALLDTLWNVGITQRRDSSRAKVLSWLYKTMSVYRGEQIAKQYLQEALHVEKNGKRVVASDGDSQELQTPEAEGQSFDSFSEIDDQALWEAQAETVPTLPHSETTAVWLDSGPNNPVGADGEATCIPELSKTDKKLLNDRTRDMTICQLPANGVPHNTPIQPEAPLESKSLTNWQPMESVIEAPARRITPADDHSIPLPISTTTRMDPTDMINIDQHLDFHESTVIELKQETSTVANSTPAASNQMEDLSAAPTSDTEVNSPVHVGIPLDNWLNTQYTTLEATVAMNKSENLQGQPVFWGKRLKWYFNHRYGYYDTRKPPKPTGGT